MREVSLAGLVVFTAAITATFCIGGGFAALAGDWPSFGILAVCAALSGWMFGRAFGWLRERP